MSAEKTKLRDNHIKLDEVLAILKAALNITGWGILVIRNNGKIEMYNEQFLRQWDITDKQISKFDNTKLLNAVLSLLEEPDEFIIRTGKLIKKLSTAVRDTVRFRDGKILERRIYPWNINGKIEGRIIAYREIQDRDSAGVSGFVKSMDMFKMVMDYIPQFIFWKDINSVFLGCNRNFAELVELENPKDIIGKTDYDLTWNNIEADAILEADRRIIENDRVELAVIESRRNRDDSIIWLEVNRIPLHDVSGNVIGILGTSQAITKRKITEEALRESEEKYRKLVECARDGIMIIQDKKIKYINPNLAETSGFSPDKLIDSSFNKIIETNKPDFFDEHVEIPDESSELGVHEALLNTKKNIKFPVEINRGLITYGTQQALILIVRNISERHKAKQVLRENLLLNEAIIENSPLGITVRDSKGRLLIENSAWKHIWAMTPERLEKDHETERKKLTLDKRDNYLGEYIPRVREVYQNGGELYIPELEIKSPRPEAAKWISHRFYAIKDEDDNVDKVVILTEDITNRKATREALVQTEARIRSLSDNVPVGIFRFTPDLEGILLSANPEMVRMFGYDNLEELTSTPLSDLYQDFRDGMKLVEILRTESKVENHEIEFRRKNGSRFWGSVSARGIMSKDENLEFVDGTLSDISIRRRASDDLHQSLEKLQKTIEDTISAMATMVEMRDPYTAGHQKRVSNLACAIAREMNLSEDTIMCIRLAGLVHDLGKISIPAEILSKPGSITEIEMEMIKGHPKAGYDILKTIDFPWPVADTVLQHHELLDGSGYPNGLKGDLILIEARIIAIADHTEAMSSHRPYRPALGIERALETLARMRGIHYDAKATTVCLKLFEQRKLNLDTWTGNF